MRWKRSEQRTGCPIEATLSVVGGVWKPLIFYALLSGRRRFGALHHLVPGSTPRMLTLQLRELEQDGVVVRTVFAEVPSRVEYELSPLGHSLEPVLAGLHEWGILYRRQLQPPEE
ncbi:helix-turn-helix domain-containing protein [Devosia sp. 1566]|uniref:winged helix-turn-helix transcriptional regulator n=1 Tax=Devosia sp. 1566 TaxID=2499144 RepID=UPI000FDAA47E|nr:helix-turn-helix domain-containing protein [Devosia sp. 1566]